jgi:2-oxoglutarate ferredoxin oxidoreductase subunit beta
MAPPFFPVAMGVIRSVETTPYDEAMMHIIEASKQKSPLKNMDDLLASGNTWDIS